MFRMNTVYSICSIAAMGGAFIGLDISSMSGILGIQAYEEQFGFPEPFVQGIITAMMPIGSLLGSLFSWYLAKSIPPKWAMQYACFIWVFGCVLQAAVPSISMLYMARFLAGVGAGIISAIVPVYQAEIAPRKVRGRVISFYQWCITWGILTQFFIQYCAVRLIDDDDMDFSKRQASALRYSFALQVVPGLVLFLGLFLVPHTPRYYATEDRWGAAVRLLADLHGEGDIRHPQVLAQYREIEEDLRDERLKGNPSFRMLLKAPLLDRLALGMSVQAWSQLCGVNIMMYYIVYIVVGAGATSPLLMASVQYLLNYICTVPAILFVDTWGRRKALLVGSFIMMICLFFMGALQQYYGQPNTMETRNSVNVYLSWIVQDNPYVTSSIIFFSCSFVITFAMTWGPISWIYPAEIFPTGVRSRAVALCTAINWACNVAVGLAVPRMLWFINYKTYYIFGAFNAVALIHMFFTAYETKGYTLEEMDEAFNSKIPPWRCHQKQSKLEALASHIELQQANVGSTGETRAPINEAGWLFRRRTRVRSI